MGSDKESRTSDSALEGQLPSENFMSFSQNGDFYMTDCYLFLFSARLDLDSAIENAGISEPAKSVSDNFFFLLID